jgi:Sulfotransferase domain
MVLRGKQLGLSMLVDRAAGKLGLTRPVLVVSGFWRSGTTWAQEQFSLMLGAKTIFEPLSWKNRSRSDQIAKANDGRGRDLLELRLLQASDSIEIWSYVEDAFFGREVTGFMLNARRRAGESFRRAAVVKDVRLQASLSLISSRFGLPVVHLRRHPCGVVASLLNAKWGWSFESVHLCDLLQPLAGAVASDPHLARLDLARFDEDVPSRIACYWAVTERLASQAARECNKIKIIRYEDAVRSPQQTFASLLHELGLSVQHDCMPERESVTSHQPGCASLSRMDAWKSQLSPAIVKRVDRVIAETLPDGDGCQLLAA